MTLTAAQAHVHRISGIAQMRGPHESEFLQAVHEVLDTLVPVLEEHPEFIEAGVLDRMIEPERQIVFRGSRPFV